MKVLMTLLVRDEEDIIEWNLRYHLLRGVDHFIVTDNLSVDGTADILRCYEQQGIVTYLRECSDDYSQDRWVTRMAEIAQSKFQPDWILHSDADEFWWPDDFADLKAAFSYVSPNARAVEVHRHNYLGPAIHRGEPFFARMVYRQRDSVNSRGLPLPPKIAHRPLEEPYVLQGNHGVSERGKLVDAAVLEGVSILHFPARTPDQLRRKIASGGAAYQRNVRFDPSVGSTWRSMHLDLLEGNFDRVIETQFLTSDEDGRNEGLVEDHRLRDFLSRF
jgi:Glycosyl transferase family 2